MIRRFSVNFAVFSMFMDTTVIAGILWLMAYVRPSLSNLASLSFVREIPQPVELPVILYAVFPMAWLVIMLFFSVYDGRKNLRVVDEFTSLTLSALVAGILLAGLLYLSYREISRFLFVTFVIFTYVALLLWRIPARLLYGWRNQKLGRERRVLIVGAGVVGREMEERLSKFAGQVRTVGFLDDDSAKQSRFKDILGTLADARTVTQKQHVTEVILALPLRAHEQMNQLIWALFDLPVRVWIVPDYFQWTLHHAEVEEFSGIPLLDVRAPALSENQRLVKRLFDITLTFLFLIPALPIMGLIALFIWLEDGFPIFFKQRRVGENGRLFTIFKFRTMVRNAEEIRHLAEQTDSQGNLIHKHREDPRVTKVGRILRRWSLDEVPQFFNILFGTMSLVGPRPEMPYLVEKYQPWQRKRFSVPQGLTGWWQIHGRSDKPMHLHTEDDLYYIQNYSIWMDIKILIQTLWIILRGKGAY